MSRLNAEPTLDLQPATGPSIIVLGRDDAGKAHASYFTADQTLQARAAAAAMGFMTLPVGTDDQRALADQLPAGKIFASGKAFVPFCKGLVYEQLFAHVPLADQVRRPLRIVKFEEHAGEAGGGDVAPPLPPATPTGKTPPLSAPSDWASIVPGSVVIAHESPDAGWWPAVILQINGHLANLRWRDYPEQISVVRPLTELALMHPSRKPTH